MRINKSIDRNEFYNRADIVIKYNNKTVSIVGYRGSKFDMIKIKYPKMYRLIYLRWKSMLQRCYDAGNPNYHKYGGKGVTVSLAWHSFSVFFYDCLKLAGWSYDSFIKGLISLDKDGLQSTKNVSNRIYSFETCQWLTSKEQAVYIDHTNRLKVLVSDFTVIHPDGKITIEQNIKKFARDNGLDDGHICKCIKGTAKSHKGYKFKPISKV